MTLWTVSILVHHHLSVTYTAYRATHMTVHACILCLHDLYMYTRDGIMYIYDPDELCTYVVANCDNH